MRVLMFSKACLVGPYQRKLEEIAKHDDVTLEVLIPPSWDDAAGQIVAERVHTDGYDLRVEPIRFNGNYHLHYYPTLKQRIREFRPDIVHLDEEPYNLATWLGWRQARASGARTLFFSWQNIRRSYPPPFAWMERQVLRGVDYALMGNQAAVDVWRQKGYEGETAVIPQFGVDPAMYTPRERKLSDKFIIGSANRRLVPEKGVDLLLRAAAQLKGDWQLHIAGEGPEKEPLIQLAQTLGIGNRVQFVGAVGSGQMPDFLRELDALVLSSRTLPNWKEQFGRILIEAMATEVAVVGSDSGEIPHVIGEAGLIFPEDDADALAAHLSTLQTNFALRQRLGQAGRQRVLTHYTQEKIAKRTVNVYREIMVQ